MRKLTRSILAATAVIGLLALPVAATADTTTVTFTVTNTGGLSVATADAAPNLGSFDTASSVTASAALPQMTVTDTTDPVSGGWTVTVGATTFSDGTNTIAGTEIGYWSGVATDTSTASGVVVPVGQQLASSAAVTLDAQRSAVVATGATGNNSATFTPSLEIDITGVVPGVYSGDVVHSVTAS